MASLDDYVPEHWPPDTIRERIHHLRRIILVHSIIYYRFNTSIIADNVFDEWTYELARIQRANPLAMCEVLYHKEAFMFFSGADAYALPLYDKRATQRALWLMRQRSEKGTWPD